MVFQVVISGNNILKSTITSTLLAGIGSITDQTLKSVVNSELVRSTIVTGMKSAIHSKINNINLKDNLLVSLGTNLLIGNPNGLEGIKNHLMNILVSSVVHSLVTKNEFIDSLVSTTLQTTIAVTCSNVSSTIVENNKIVNNSEVINHIQPDSLQKKDKEKSKLLSPNEDIDPQKTYVGTSYLKDEFESSENYRFIQDIVYPETTYLKDYTKKKSILENSHDFINQVDTKNNDMYNKFPTLKKYASDYEEGINRFKFIIPKNLNDAISKAFALISFTSAPKILRAIANSIQNENFSEVELVKSVLNKNISVKNNVKIIQNFETKLTPRQNKLLEMLPSTGSKIQLNRSQVNMNDLAALTKKTGHEFVMFTQGSRRLIIRGDEVSVNFNVKDIMLKDNSFQRFSGHTHPGRHDLTLLASGMNGDRNVLLTLGQERSLILNSIGKRNIFDMENDYIIRRQIPIYKIKN